MGYWRSASDQRGGRLFFPCAAPWTRKFFASIPAERTPAGIVKSFPTVRRKRNQNPAECERNQSVGAPIRSSDQGNPRHDQRSKHGAQRVTTLRPSDPKAVACNELPAKNWRSKEGQKNLAHPLSRKTSAARCAGQSSSREGVIPEENSPKTSVRHPAQNRPASLPRRNSAEAVMGGGPGKMEGFVCDADGGRVRQARTDHGDEERWR